MNDKTEPTSTSESKTNSELSAEILALKEEIQLLQSVNQMINPSDSVPNEERVLKWRQVAPDIKLMLDSKGYNEAYRAVTMDIQNQLFNTHPGETEQRERLYYLAQGMQLMAIKLAYMVSTVRKLKPDE